MAVIGTAETLTEISCMNDYEINMDDELDDEQVLFSFDVGMDSDEDGELTADSNGETLWGFTVMADPADDKAA